MYKVELFTIKKIEPPSNNEHPLILFQILIIFQMKPKYLNIFKNEYIYIYIYIYIYVTLINMY